MKNDKELVGFCTKATNSFFIHFIEQRGTKILSPACFVKTFFHVPWVEIDSSMHIPFTRIAFVFERVPKFSRIPIGGPTLPLFSISVSGFLEAPDFVIDRSKHGPLTDRSACLTNIGQFLQFNPRHETTIPVRLYHEWFFDSATQFHSNRSAGRADGVANSWKKILEGETDNTKLTVTNFRSSRPDSEFPETFEHLPRGIIRSYCGRSIGKTRLVMLSMIFVRGFPASPKV